MIIINTIYKKLRRLLERDGSSQNRNTENYEPIKNIYSAAHSKKALVSFITYAFNQPTENLSHTNILECNTICELLDEKGYNVDLIDYQNSEAKIKNNYDVIVGFGQPIENILINGSEKKFKLILYRNGCDQSFADQASLARVEAIFKKTGKLLISSSRVSPGFWRAQIRFADTIIALGNKFVSDTYTNESSGIIKSLDLFYYDVNTIDFTVKNFETSKNNFLWFGSFGAIHKGLDLVIDYFSTRPQFNLFICGINKIETDFLELYSEKLALPNINDLGFIQLQSTEFKELLYKCGAIITPSVSEAGAPAILNVVAAGGLIPILTESCGVSFDGNEILMHGLSQDALDIAIKSFSEINPESLRIKSISINLFVRNRYTYQNFRNKLKDIIKIDLKTDDVNGDK